MLFENVDPSPTHVPADVAVYAIGDIHGRVDLLREILSAIELDSKRHPRLNRRLVFVGDYVSRGPDSKGVIDLLLNLEWPGFRTVFLKGNHEDCMLRFLAGDLLVGSHWLSKGGAETLKSYGVACDGDTELSEAVLDKLRTALANVVPHKHLRFLRELSRSYHEGNCYFVHAGIKPGVALHEQCERDQLWIRRRFHQSEYDHGAIIVHGHHIASEVVVKPNRIGIDTGASSSGRLSCLVIEDNQFRILQTGKQ